MRWRLEHNISKQGRRVFSCHKYGILHTLNPSGTSHVIRTQRGYHFLDTCRSCFMRIFPACGLPCAAHEARSPLCTGMDHGKPHPPSHRSSPLLDNGNKPNKPQGQEVATKRAPSCRARCISSLSSRHTHSRPSRRHFPLARASLPVRPGCFLPAHYGKSPYTAP